MWLGAAKHLMRRFFDPFKANHELSESDSADEDADDDVSIIIAIITIIISYILFLRIFKSMDRNGK